MGYIAGTKFNPEFWDTLEDIAFDHSDWQSLPDDLKATAYYSFGVDTDFNHGEGIELAAEMFNGEGCSFQELTDFHSTLLRFMSESFSNLSYGYDSDSRERIPVSENMLAAVANLRDSIFSLCRGYLDRKVSTLYSQAKEEQELDYEEYLENSRQYAC